MTSHPAVEFYRGRSPTLDLTILCYATIAHPHAICRIQTCSRWHAFVDFFPSNAHGRMWVRLLEAWLTARLLSSPSFHRTVQLLHKRLRDLRHGKDPSEMGGTNIDKPDAPDAKRFISYYIEELRQQIRGGGNSKR